MEKTRAKEVGTGILMFYGFFFGPPLFAAALAWAAIWLITGWSNPAITAISSAVFMMALFSWGGHLAQR